MHALDGGRQAMQYSQQGCAMPCPRHTQTPLAQPHCAVFAVPACSHPGGRTDPGGLELLHTLAPLYSDAARHGTAGWDAAPAAPWVCS